jgi:hypothetical protein
LQKTRRHLLGLLRFASEMTRRHLRRQGQWGLFLLLGLSVLADQWDLFVLFALFAQ